MPAAAKPSGSLIAEGRNDDKMAQTIQQILGYVALQEAIETVKPGIPFTLPDGFMNMREDTILDMGRYVQFEGTRRTSQRTAYNAPHVQVALRDIEQRDVKLIPTREKITLEPWVFKFLRSYNAYEIDQAKKEVARNIFNFKKRFENLRIAAITSTVFKGLIWFDANNNILPSSSGAEITIDYLVPANNKNQLNGIIGTSWATTSADIVSDIRAIKKQALRNTGYPIRHVFYGDSIPSYLSSNDSFKEYLARDGRLFRDAFISTGEIPDGVLGLTWWPSYEMFYEDSAGTNQSFVGADDCVFYPDLDMNIYGLLEGTTEVPTNFGVMNDAMAAINSFKTVNGQYSYATINIDPPAAHMHAGDVFLPVLKIGEAGGVFLADVTP